MRGGKIYCKAISILRTSGAYFIKIKMTFTVRQNEKIFFCKVHAVFFKKITGGIKTA